MFSGDVVCENFFRVRIPTVLVCMAATISRRLYADGTGRSGLDAAREKEPVRFSSASRSSR